MIWVHIYIMNVGRNRACGRKRDSSPLFWLWLDIPAVLQGRDFSDELYGGKTGEEKVNTCTTSQKSHSEIYEWNHLEEACWGLIYPFLRPFTARSQMVITMFEIKQLEVRSILPKCGFDVYKSKSIPVISVYRDLKVPLVTVRFSFNTNQKTTNVGLEAVLHLQLY